MVLKVLSSNLVRTVKRDEVLSQSDDSEDVAMDAVAMRRGGHKIREVLLAGGDVVKRGGSKTVAILTSLLFDIEVVRTQTAGRNVIEQTVVHVGTRDTSHTSVQVFNDQRIRAGSILGVLPSKARQFSLARSRLSGVHHGEDRARRAGVGSTQVHSRLDIYESSAVHKFFVIMSTIVEGDLANSVQEVFLDGTGDTLALSGLVGGGVGSDVLRHDGWTKYQRADTKKNRI